MRIALYTLFILMFSWSALAEELKCSSAPASPSEAFVQYVVEHYPTLDENQVIAIAKGYELADNQDTLANEATTDQERVFAERGKKVALSVTALLLKNYEIKPKLGAVLKRMDAEKAAGRKFVSDELEPEVREVAHEALVTGLAWSELELEATTLLADRFIAVRTTNIPEALNRFTGLVCMLEAFGDARPGIVNFVPIANMIVIAKKIYY